MDCERIDSLLLSYCENELPPYLRQEVETHIAHCQRCLDLVRFIHMESQALRMKQDIPEPGSNLPELICQKVLKEASRQGPATVLKAKNLKTWGSKRFAGVLAAVLLIAWVGFWNVTKNINGNHGQPPRTAQLKSHSLSTARQQPSSSTESEKGNEIVEQSIRDKNRNTKTMNNSQEQMITASKKSPNPEEEITPFVYPSYVPDGFRLISVVSDSENRLTITYADDLDRQIILKVWPEGGENSKAMTGAMVSAKTAAPDNSTTMILTVTREDQRYFVQLQGDISAQEMAKMADSLCWHD